MNTQKQIILIVVLSFIFVGGCAAYTAIELPIRVPAQQEWTRDQSLERGALLFANNCRTCHGNRGQGGVGPQLLNNPLTAFQDQDPLKLSQNMTLLTRTIQCGRASTLMPAWLNTNGGALNAIQIQHIVNFLTNPIEVDEATGSATSHWWDEAEHFAHNLNAEVAVLIGGDTLSTIAKAHGIGPRQLAEYNNLPLEGNVKKGTEIRIPPFAQEPDGYIYTVYKDNETITKIAEAQFVGAVLIADLNGLAYEFSEKRGVATMHLKTENGSDVAGLFPGTELELPDAATYIVASGDTIESVAEKHDLSESQLVGLNRDVLGSLDSDEEIPFRRTLELPKQVVVVQEGDTFVTIADQHDIASADLAAENALEEDAILDAGTELKLPADALYTIQAGDTLAIVAQIHATTTDELARANGLQPTDSISPDVVLQLPKIESYIVQGQDLAQVAASYGNVTAASLAEKNGVEENTILAVSTQLRLPEDAFGSAPPDAVNTGAACVVGTVPQNIMNVISGVEIKEPETISTTVKFEAHANDWTVIADGTALQPNQGGVKVRVGTAVDFASIAGLHNILLNKEKQGEDINTGDTRRLTFNDPGEVTVGCSYHPAMQAVVWVE